MFILGCHELCTSQRVALPLTKQLQINVMKLHHSLKKLQMNVQPNTFGPAAIGCLWMAEQQALKGVILTL